MSEKMQKFRVSRLKQLIFPKELIIDHAHVMTRKRRFPAFWVIKEESIPLRKVAAIQITHGLIFSTVLVENSGGPWPIEVSGLPKKQAVKIRSIIEAFKPDSQNKPDKSLDFDLNNPIKSKPESKGIIKHVISKIPKRQNTDEPIIEALDSAWDGAEFDPINAKPFESRTESKSTYKTSGEKQKSTPRRRLMDDPLPSIDEVLYSANKSDTEKQAWISDLVEPPKRK